MEKFIKIMYSNEDSFRIEKDKLAELLYKKVGHRMKFETANQMMILAQEYLEWEDIEQFVVALPKESYNYSAEFKHCAMQLI
jgi:hypothetical protein